MAPARNRKTRAEIEKLLNDKSVEELKLRLTPRIAFGTAGLRARMEGGFARMNDVTVLQASQGLCAYLLDNVADAETCGVVVGHDHRHNSERFARLTAGVFIRNGVRCYLLRGLVHTPMVPFSTRKLGAAAGVMITASHNPAADNGYKVYYSNAVQIIPPHDAGIASAIDKHLDIDAAAWEVDGVIDSALCVDRTEDMKDAYFEMVAGLATRSKEVNRQAPLFFTYTPMHGVGLPFAHRALIRAYGFSESHFVPVPQQAHPDPDFPTVKFPNPEEKGALKLAMKKAESDAVDRGKKSAMVVANDPDADRFCAAEWNGTSWQVFSGDQIGAILGVWIFDQYKASGKPVNKLAMLASTVSSKLLNAVAEKEGFTFEETLTGFKYLGNQALVLENERGLTVPFAYEEAIGYMCGHEVRDKDGVTALMAWAEMASGLAENGRLVGDYLQDIYRRYGHFVTSNSYFICRQPAKIDAAFARLRFGEKANDPTVPADPIVHLRLPKTIAGFPVTSIRDLTVGYDSSNPPTFKPSLPVSNSSHMITFTVGGDDGCVVVGTVRTSGTEPKVKYYLEGTAATREDAVRKLGLVEEALGDEWLHWRESGFEKAAG